MKKKLAIITSHPVQYNAPWFAMLASSSVVTVKVFYTWGQTKAADKFDPGFGKTINWDIPLLEGYEAVFVENIAKDPGSHHFNGIVTPSLNQQVAQWKPDAVLVFGWSFNSHLRCMRFFKGKVPVLFRGDSTLLDETGGLKKILRRTLLKWVYRHVAFALYVGIHNRQYFEAHGLKAAQLIYAPHAIDNDRFADLTGKHAAAAASLRLQAGFATDDIVLLFAGKFEPKKNPFYLVHLLQQNNLPKVKVLLVGNGVLEADLKQAINGDKRFVFMPFQNQQQMPVLYRMADLFVLPSGGPGETWGLAVNEAMACGLPVAVSEKAGAAGNLVNEGVNGIIIRSNEQDKLAA
ncbi:MAG: hypothetical protein RL172_2229, partial [Bacteroidota bacterium]